MGTIRRLKRRMGSKVAIADTGMVINGCQIFLGNSNPVKATSESKRFSEMLRATLERASIPNMSDMYKVMTDVRGRLLVGGSILN